MDETLEKIEPGKYKTFISQYPVIVWLETRRVQRTGKGPKNYYLKSSGILKTEKFWYWQIEDGHGYVILNSGTSRRYKTRKEALKSAEFAVQDVIENRR